MKDVEATQEQVMVTFYVNSEGLLLGGWTDNPPSGAIEVPAPEYYDQVWQFPGWGPSPSFGRNRELEWQASEMLVIANQLMALEEEADDALPGTKHQWLSYRTLIRLWQDSSDFPDDTKRPIRPV